MKIKKTRGGKRSNSGRKPANYKTVTIAFRVREEWQKEIKAIVKAKVNQLKDDL